MPPEHWCIPDFFYISNLLSGDNLLEASWKWHMSRSTPNGVTDFKRIFRGAIFFEKKLQCRLPLSAVCPHPPPRPCLTVDYFRGFPRPTPADPGAGAGAGGEFSYIRGPFFSLHLPTPSCSPHYCFSSPARFCLSLVL